MSATNKVIEAIHNASPDEVGRYLDAILRRAKELGQYEVMASRVQFCNVETMQQLAHIIRRGNV